MKKKVMLIVAAAAVALLASPVLAQTGGQGSKAQKRETTGAKTAPRLFVGPGVTSGNAVYDCTGKYLGTDPDPNIRSQLLKSGGDDSCSMGGGQ